MLKCLLLATIGVELVYWTVDWLQEPAADAADADEANGAAGGQDLRQGVTALMDVMRDLLSSIRFIPAPVDNVAADGAADDDEDEDDNENNWQ